MTYSIAVDEVTAPHVPAERLQIGALLASAGLMGFGLILFIAANWDAMGRFQRFGLVAAVIAAGAVAALANTALRAPGLLLAFAGTGGLLALIGQTYQTGADAWQLFALWAALTLPWAVAARSDAIWTPWVIVAMTAVGLWYHTHSLWQARLFLPAAEAPGIASFLGIPLQVLSSWVLSIAVCMLVAPWRPLDQWLGARGWAFRVALLLTVTLIASHAIEAVIGLPRVGLATYAAGLLCLGGIAAWLVRSPRRDILLIAATALAIDTTLVFGFARLIWPSAKSAEWGVLTLIGLVAAGLVAASVVAIMRLVRGGGRATGNGETVVAPSLDAARPWPVVLLSGVGALMAALPFLTAIGLILGAAIEKGPVTYIVALVTLPVAIQIVRNGKGLFVEQLAIVGLAAGTLLLVWGLFRDLPIGLAGAISGAMSIAMALFLRRTWLASLLGAAATVGFAIALDALVPGLKHHRGPAFFAIVWSALAIAGVVLGQAHKANCGWLQPLGAVVGRGDVASATLWGWLAATLAGLAFGSGSTFLLGAHLGGSNGVTGIAEAVQWLSPARGISGVLAVVACAWARRDVPSLRTPLASALMAIGVVLAVVMPALGAVGLVLLLALVSRQRAIAIAAGVAALWIIGAFYYNLSMPLMRKAALLAACGAALGVMAMAAGPRLAALSLPSGPIAPAGSLAWMRGLALVGLLLVGGVAAEAIRSKETLIRNGAPVFIELAPVDPRSLMQGDYMALRFHLPDAALRHQPTTGARPHAIGSRDANGVVRLTRIGTAETPLNEGEMRIELAPKGGRWIVVTDAWFFKEGTGQKWEAARFGELRVLPDGRALLVGLADKDRLAIR